VAAVLVVDDEADRLATLVDTVRAELEGEASVRPWQPTRDEDPLQRFDSETSAGVDLIVTDQDLTKGGYGLLGSAVTSWAQDQFIPVCNFSRKAQRRLPRERDFFEIRVPSEPDEKARAMFIARIYRGFRHIREYIAAVDSTQPSARLLAGAMGVPELEDDLSPYLSSVASARSSLLQALATGNQLPSGDDRVKIISFILGHVLLNAVLEFPGPILNQATVAAYCAVSEQMADELSELFASAGYSGPFATGGMYFLRRLIDDRIDELAEGLIERPAEPDQYTRAVVARATGHVIPHGCPRCGGTRGGYWCPFTGRAVCDRTDCSVASTTWIPRGAALCRVEHDYFEEMAPLLGE
jgi:hypothetical protein